MGKKKPTLREEDAPHQGGGAGKSKKKNLVIDDDEYSFGSEVPEESLVKEDKVAPAGGKKKGKKKNFKGGQARENKDIDDDDDDKNLDEKVEELDISESVFSGKKKSKGKSGGDNTTKKVGFDILGFEGEDDVQSDEDEPVISFTGKKKSSTGSKKGGQKTSFALLEEQDDEQDEDVQSEEDELIAPNFEGKKKSKGSKKSSGLLSASAFDAIGDEEGDEAEVDHSVDNDDEVAVIAFSGKKKKSKSSKKGSSTVLDGSGFDALDYFSGEKNLGENEPYEDFESITFDGKKKRSSKSEKKTGNFFSAVLLDEENEDNEDDSEPPPVSGFSEVDDVLLTFTGKRKSSKKKGSSASAALGDNVAAEVADVATSNIEENDIKPAQATSAVSETSKNKKKKKKSARTVQEEEDLDKILAELGEAPPVSKPDPSPAPQLKDEKADKPSEPISLVEGDKEDEEQGVVESAAAKKKKKKKEKEKEKKAAAEEKKEEVKNDKGKVADRKLSKHVKEMQEALARRQAAEERQKKEEQERLRKEEEERRKQEELERQAEEARLRKKERDKEKLRQKREAGMLLTAKQKEEQRRLEIMRKQFLSAGIPLPTVEDGAPSKRPIYKTKKSKQHHGQTPGAKTQTSEEEKTKEEAATDIDSIENEKTEEVAQMDVEEAAEAADETPENGVAKEEDDDDEDWDAKSWDDTDLGLQTKGAFDDEEADTPALPAAKKESKKAIPLAADVPPPPGVTPITAAKKATSHPASCQASENKQKPSEVEAPGKNKGNEAHVNKETASFKSESVLRSPICCIMGHVDTGKTKLLDCIRGTNVQEGEAGGITQQIGATYFPAANIRDRTKELKADAKLNVPGLLVIDTPGHESFTNLRSRGSGLCDIAILVVDIMHGLEPQTLESLNLLKMRNTEFIVALNKVDRLYGWKTCRNAPIVKAMKQQTRDVQNEFNMRLTQIITQFKEQGLNTELYYKNKEMGETFSIVPTSAISGEGIPDMLLLLVNWTQKTMVEKLTFSNKVQCTVLEVKVVEGHGTTIDVVLVNGVLHEGDQIVVCGMQGPIVTTIRALLTPHPMKELRVKGTYLHHKEIKAAQGIKITAQGLEHAIAGTGLYVVGPDDDLENITDLAKEDMDSVMSRIDKSGEGVCVQASTLGSLEALLEFLKSPAVSIPVSAVSIGPVHKKDVMKAGVMLEKKKEYATILAFDVKVTPEAREYADEVGVKIFMADIIYHLFDQFKAYIDNIKEEKKKEAADEAVFPCVLKIMPNCVFNKKDPIVLGVDVVEGIAKVGTPICIPSQEFIDIGRIASIENNHKPVDIAKKGQKVAIKILGSNPEEQQKMFGRHFDMDDELVSHISRKSIDTLKANYRDDLSIEEWKLVVKLKTVFKIQ
ncbi:uncharacterized protein LOC141642841 [Silene latifolia]|uniref:uncharacterized protein LOC141642841 n=1 Tax=Silene latifolia TaxID=37657 RepID=UPI003D782A69